MVQYVQYIIMYKTNTKQIFVYYIFLQQGLLLCIVVAFE